MSRDFTFRRRRMIALALGVSLGALATAAAAKPAPQKTASQSALVDEVVVTARKREERLLDVPVSANALSAEAIQKYGATDINSIAQRLPQVNIVTAQNGSGAVVSIRGIGSAATDSSIEQEVTLNVDGVPTSRGRIVQEAFFDEASIQVLKGPQALYFGKNSPAGVISIDSVSPGRVQEGYARVGYGTAAKVAYGEFAISQPLTDDLSARVAVRISDMSGGYIQGGAQPITNPASLPAYLALTNTPLPGAPQRSYPASKDRILRATLRWTPSSPVDATFKFLVSDYRDNGDSTNTVISSCNPVIGHPAVVDLGASLLGRSNSLLVDPNGTCSIYDRKNDYGNVPASIAAGMTGSNGGVPYASTFTKLGSAVVNYHVSDWLTLTSVSGYYGYTHKSFSNYDYTIFSAVNNYVRDENDSYMQELRGVTSINGPVNFSGGLFYEYDERHFFTALSLGYLPPVPGSGTIDDAHTSQLFTDNTYSAFGELNIKPLRLVELDVGARVTHERKYAKVGMDFLNPALAKLALAAGQTISDDFSLDNVSPQATLSWHPKRDVLIYGAYKTGFKSGGFSSVGLVPVNATAANQRFNSENVAGGEIGLKWANALPGLTGDLTVYRYIYSNLQLTAFDTASTAFFTINAGSAVAQGVELNLHYRATSELALSGSIGYNRGRFLSFPNAPCWNGQTKSTNGVTPTNPNDPLLSAMGGRYCVGGVQNLGGQQLPRAPDWTIVYGFDWNHPLGRGNWTLGLSAEARYSSKYVAAPDLNPFLTQKPYTLVNLSARLYNGSWEGALIVQNATDKTYIVNGGGTVLGPAGQTDAQLGPAREITLQVTRKF